MKITLLVTGIIVLLSMYYMQFNETKRKKNLILGVTLPLGEDDVVTAVIARFKREMLLSLVILSLSLLAMWFLDEDWLLFVYMVWILLAIALPFVPVARGNRALLARKREQNWGNVQSSVRAVDLKLMQAPAKTLSPLYFLPALLLCLVPLLVQWLQGELRPSAYLSSLTMLPIVLLMYVLYRVSMRQRADLFGSTALSSALTQVRRYNWSKMYLYLSYSVAALSLAMVLSEVHALLSLILVLVVCLFLTVISLRIEMTVRRAQQTLTAQVQEAILDEDDHWLWGSFYINPHDNRLFVPMRVGVNLSVNFAKPAGKVLAVLTAAIMLSLPFLGAWFLIEARTPLRLELSETTLTAQHTGAYEIALSDITHVELLETLPRSSRTWGTGTDTLLKGEFYSSAYGSSTYCLDPRFAPFLLIQTAEKTYLFGTRDTTQLTDIYAILQTGGYGR